MLYGMISGGVLLTKDYTPEELEEVQKALDTRLLPVDPVDYSKTQPTSEGHYVEIVPYVNGDHISYQYVEKYDRKAINAQIDGLKEQLTADDYKVIKCYEASLTGEEQPYDIKELHTKRQSLRQQINELQEKLAGEEK